MSQKQLRRSAWPSLQWSSDELIAARGLDNDIQARKRKTKERQACELECFFFSCGVRERCFFRPNPKYICTAVPSIREDDIDLFVLVLLWMLRVLLLLLLISKTAVSLRSV